MDTVGVVTLSGFLTIAFCQVTLIAIGRIWHYSKQACDLMQEQNAMLRMYISGVNDQSKIR